MRYMLLADESHVDQLYELINGAYRTSEGAGRWTTEHHLVDGDRITHDGIGKLIADDSISFIAGFEHDVPVCCIAIRHCATHIELGTFAVEPSRQGQGIGKALLNYAEQFVGHLGKPLVVHVVSENQPLIDFYQQRGYQANGEIHPYPINDNVGIPKKAGLTLTVLCKGTRV